MPKRALIVGIDNYNHVSSLTGCVADATAMQDVLSRNDDGSLNFTCRILTSPGHTSITKGFLRQQWRELFQECKGDVLFYFSGHGTPTDVGGYLVTQDGTPDDPGLPMDDVVTLANNSSASTVLLILDCCFSGSVGNPPSLQANSLEDRALLREGVTILAASRPTQVSLEVGGHGVFTNLVLGALKGGAADVRGRVSAASIYAYAEAALGAWDQRPLYKSHAAHLDPVRLCEPKVSDDLLRELPIYFPHAEYEYKLDITYEETNQGAAIAAHVVIFKKFKRLQIGGLLKPKTGDDLYWSAAGSGYVLLTDLGKFYLQLVKDARI
jgi:Caspase domain